MLDPGGFGAITITKSITINVTHGAGFGSILAAGVNGVIINITAAGDTRKTVRLVSLNINGANTGINGIRILAATAVHIEDTSLTVLPIAGSTIVAAVAASLTLPTAPSGIRCRAASSSYRELVP